MSGLEHTSIGDFEFGLEFERQDDPAKVEAKRMVQSRAMSLLKQDHSHARKIREYDDQAKADQMRIARLEGVLRLAVPVLRAGDDAERADVAASLEHVLRATS